jgi:hypothetical protein
VKLSVQTPGVKRRLAIAAAAALVLAGTAAAAEAPTPWDHAQTGLTYPVFRPTVTLGLKLAKFSLLQCPPGQDEFVSASYGTAYVGRNFGKTRGFSIGEGYPICANAGIATVVGHRTIGGATATVAVYCDPPKTCTLADGVKNGYTLSWRARPVKGFINPKRTQMFMDSSKLTLTQLLSVANGLEFEQ